MDNQSYRLYSQYIDSFYLMVVNEKTYSSPKDWGEMMQNRKNRKKRKK